MKRAIHRSPFISRSVLLAVAVTLFTPLVARAAAECSHDADCAEGYACKHETVEDPSAPACRDGDNDCICDYKDCAADSDCPAWAACKEFTFSVCTTNTASHCSPKMTQTFCVPRANLPCEHDADCSDGYTCSVETSGQECHMYLGLGESDDEGDAGMSATSEERCKTCELKDLSCKRDADCPASMKCVDPYSHDEWEENGSAPHTVCYPYPYHTGTMFQANGDGQQGMDAGTTKDKGVTHDAKPDAKPDAGPHETAPVDSANDEKKKDDSGCSAAQGSDDAGPLGAISLLVLCASVLRRRTRRA
jgi:hypothetical protein